MSDDLIDDAEEFAEKAAEYEKRPKDGQAISKTQSEQPQSTPKGMDGLDPGSVTQWALYRGGYAPTTNTVHLLPPGCYDITFDEKTAFAVPSLTPSGLLLELPEMRSEEVIRVVENFWNSEADYKDGNEFVIGGAAYKAGLMIYGPPGSGKSCTIKLVSKKLVERGGTVFHANTRPGQVLSFLSDFSRIERNRKSIVILEDIDTLIETWGESTYLEMLDSAKTIDNVLFIATTNYPEKLDPRIYNRPGRFSHVIKIGMPGPEMKRAYLKAILKNHRDVEEIVNNSQGFTIDHLNALLNAVYREKKHLSTEMERLRKMFRMPKSTEDNKLGV